jgi:hypothetical protein
MFRRRGFRIARRARRIGASPLLQRANQLFTAGDYAGAAQAFEQLARGAEEQFPDRAPFLYLEAGRAHIFGGQNKPGLAFLRRGLTMLGSQGRFRRMQRIGRRAIDELKGRGLTAEANEIAALLSGNLPATSEPELAIPAKKPILPTHCPSCGAGVRSDEVEWLDDLTAECDYCGSPVRGEQR